MAVIKCKMCGGNLIINEGSPTAECEYCGSLQTVPNAENEKMLNMFLRANRLRANCEFDKAFGVYETIAAEFPEEAEAYWGLVLCKFGVEYVDDPATGKKIPTCHRSSFNSVMEDEDFEQAVENATPVARKIYREEAKQIEQLRKDILEVSGKETPYDIFICYKETAEDGNRTLDSVLAQDIYNALTDKGYRVFFSRITLEDKLGQEYEPYIFAALNSAKVMLAVGTDYEYFNAVWVRNEWSRYLRLMETDKNKHLIPCFKNVDAYDLPKEFAKLQAQDLGKVGAMQDLLRGIDKLIAPVVVATPANTQGSNIAELLEMGNRSLQEKDWGTAMSRFDMAFVANPQCADAHIGKLMAERHIKQKEDLSKCRKRLEKSSHFCAAMECANDAQKEEMETWRKRVAKRCVWRIVYSCVLLLVLILTYFPIAIWHQVHYAELIAPYYAGNVSAEDTYNKLSASRLYKVDDCTKYLLRKDIEDPVYPEVESLTELKIPEGIEVIRESAFMGCEELKSVVLPDSVKTIGAQAFMKCTKLETIELSHNLQKIEASAFCDCISLRSVDLPDTLKIIEYAAFSRCTALESIVLPDGLTTIGEYAFNSCTRLYSFIIPDGVTNVGTFILGMSPLLELKIYCEAEEKPEGWADNWVKEKHMENVTWGYKG